MDTTGDFGSLRLQGRSSDSIDIHWLVRDTVPTIGFAAHLSSPL
jgi:hypothetical protein